MKKVINIFYVITFLYCYSVTSQQLVQNISDIYKLKDNEGLFINKPLQVLLKEINPEIKTANPLNSELSFVFGFRWTTLAQQRKREGSVADRVTLLVNVKDFIEWNWNERPVGNEIEWTKEDSNKYGNLIVTDIEVLFPKDK